jgi:hypothetical protein
VIRPGHLVELFVNFRTITTGGVRPTQVFLTKLDRVVIINKIGSRVFFFFSSWKPFSNDLIVSIQLRGQHSKCT